MPQYAAPDSNAATYLNKYIHAHCERDFNFNVDAHHHADINTVADAHSNLNRQADKYTASHCHASTDEHRNINRHDHVDPDFNFYTYSNIYIHA